MKKLILAIFVVTIAWSCVRDDLQSAGTSVNPDFTIEEAKAFFDKHMTLPRATRSTTGKNGLIPGDFTVEWKNAKQSTRRNHSNLEFAIKGSYAFRVIRSDFENGQAKAYIVPVYQKLLVVKNTERNRLSNYIMTIIPDRSYFESHKNFDPQRFTVYGDRAEFSGLVIYSTIENRSLPFQVCVFRSGIKVEDYSIFKFGVDEVEKLKSMIEILKGFKVLRANVSVMTRGSGEDSWEDLTEELDMEMEDMYNEMMDILHDMRDAVEIDEVVCTEQPYTPPQREYYVEPDESNPYIGDDDYYEGPNPGNPESEDKTVTYYNVQVTGTDEEKQWIKSCLDKIAESKIGKQLLDKIASMDIKINCVDAIPGYPGAEALAHPNGTIDTNYPCNGGLFEDMFHQYQFHIPPTDQSRGNREFEAKCADAIAVQEGLYFGSKNDKWDVYLDYMNDPTKDNFNNAVNDMRNDGYLEAKFPINTSVDMLPHLGDFTNK